jgi:hypothetical protein
LFWLEEVADIGSAFRGGVADAMALFVQQYRQRPAPSID